MTKSSSTKESKRNGIIATIAIHVGVLLLMMFFGFTYMTPPIGDVSIGFEAMGQEDAGSTDQVSSAEQVNENQNVETPTPTSSDAQPVEDDVATQDDSPVDIPPIDKPKNKIDKPKETVDKKDPVEPVKKQPKVDDRVKDLGALLKGDNQDGGKGSNNNAGNEGGETGGTDGSGKNGNGVDGMFDFGGRKASSPGNLNHDCGISGRIKVRVTVDREGNVVKAERVGGTTGNKCLTDKAILAAKATKYTGNPSGPLFQEGTIELYFQLE